MSPEKQTKNKGKLAPQWKPGQSGNPKGRPPIDNAVAPVAREVLASAREGESSRLRNILNKMADLAEEGSVPHANLLLSYGYGRPAERIETKDVTPYDDRTEAWVALVQTNETIQREYIAFLRKKLKSDKPASE